MWSCYLTEGAEKLEKQSDKPGVIWWVCKVWQEFTPWDTQFYNHMNSD